MSGMELHHAWNAGRRVGDDAAFSTLRGPYDFSPLRTRLRLRYGFPTSSVSLHSDDHSLFWHSSLLAEAPGVEPGRSTSKAWRPTIRQRSIAGLAVVDDAVNCL